MLCAMERTIGNYTIEAGFFTHNWRWDLLPSIQLFFDEVFFGIQFSFLCFNLTIDVTNEKRYSEWERILNEKSSLFKGAKGTKEEKAQE